MEKDVEKFKELLDDLILYSENFDSEKDSLKVFNIKRKELIKMYSEPKEPTKED